MQYDPGWMDQCFESDFFFVSAFLCMNLIEADVIVLESYHLGLSGSWCQDSIPDCIHGPFTDPELDQAME